MPHRQIAEALGVSSSAVATKLIRMRRRGIPTYDRCQRWPLQDRLRLRKLYAQGASVGEIAASLHRPNPAVRSKARKMGLLFGPLQAEFLSVDSGPRGSRLPVERPVSGGNPGSPPA